MTEQNTVTGVEALPFIMTVPEACRALRIGRSKGYDLVRCGRLRSVRMGGNTIRIPREAILELLNEGK